MKHLLIFLAIFLIQLSICTEISSKEMTTKQNNNTKFYLYSNDSINQEIEVLKISKNKIKFKYKVNNNKRNKSRVISGIAICPNYNLDPEIDEDYITGEAYPSYEYFYPNYIKDYFRIRIDCESASRVIVSRIKNYKSFEDDPFCPINSVKILRIDVRNHNK